MCLVGMRVFLLLNKNNDSYKPDLTQGYAPHMTQTFFVVVNINQLL